VIQASKLQRRECGPVLTWIYGALTKDLLDFLSGKEGFSIHFFNRVQDLRRNGDLWNLQIRDEKSGENWDVQAKFVFLGAGGGALPLLQKSKIPEGMGYAGFPVSGVWLRCDDPEVSSRHDVKVYGKASVGSPPMSVPHLDTRHVEGKVSLLFGPYVGFSTKFLKMDHIWISSAPSIRKIYYRC
jgi:malate dehydrogenase (quinone)